jgi:hypothetical protein
MKTSKRFRLNYRNLVKGSIYAVMTALMTEVTVAVSGWNTFEDISYQRFIIVSGVALFSYLSTKLLQDENGNYLNNKKNE